MINDALLYVARQNIQVDEIVQIGWRGRRLWCIVTAVDHDMITAIVDSDELNTPFNGCIIYFTRDQILDVREDVFVTRFSLEIGDC